MERAVLRVGMSSTAKLFIEGATPMTHDFKRVLDALDNGKAIDALEWLDANLPTIRHALALAEQNKTRPAETAPKDGSAFYSVGYYQIPYRWKFYHVNSEQFRRGIKGRWQCMGDYGGWQNAEEPPSGWKTRDDE